MSYSEIKSQLHALPKTWYPGLLKHIVEECIEQKVFKKGRIQHVVATIEADDRSLREYEHFKDALACGYDNNPTGSTHIPKTHECQPQLLSALRVQMNQLEKTVE